MSIDSLDLWFISLWVSKLFCYRLPEFSKSFGGLGIIFLIGMALFLYCALDHSIEAKHCIYVALPRRFILLSWGAVKLVAPIPNCGCGKVDQIRSVCKFVSNLSN